MEKTGPSKIVPAATPATAPAERLLSLDALRGFDMMWIVGADAVGGALSQLRGGPAVRFAAAQLDHSQWSGIRFYDLIFPLFVFMVGVAIPFSLDRIVSAEGRREAMGRVARRTFLLYLLGLFYYGGLSTTLDQLRLLGVLQRIALCYCGASLLYLWLSPRGLVAVVVGLLLGYWALLTFVPVPGFGAGDFREGHNLANWIDGRFLPLRKWDGDHDPEGLLSTFPAIASCLLGVFAGRWTRDPTRSPQAKVWLLALAGCALLATGLLWGLQFPLIKKIWTSSFVLAAGGWGMLLLAAFYQVADVWKIRFWLWPLAWLGSNALAIYLVSNVVDFSSLSARIAGGAVAASLNGLWPGLGALVLALVSIALCMLLCGFLYRRRIFLRL
jgi:predicted acyltransferase